jgi:hypothetical protein
MCKREDTLDHLTAKAEVTRRQLEAQLAATQTAKRNSNYMAGPQLPFRSRQSQPLRRR